MLLLGPQPRPTGSDTLGLSPATWGILAHSVLLVTLFSSFTCEMSGPERVGQHPDPPARVCFRGRPPWGRLTPWILTSCFT